MSPDRLTPADIAEHLYRTRADWLPRVFPAGRREGPMFLLGDADGSPGRSLPIKLTEGCPRRVSDFAGGFEGDFLALYGRGRGLGDDQRAAVKLAAREFGLERHEAFHGRPAPAKPMSPPDDDIPMPAEPKANGHLNGHHHVPMLHPQPAHQPGEVGRWTYQDADGLDLFTVVRIQRPGKRKAYWRYNHRQGKWLGKRANEAEGGGTLPDPTPLYRLPEILANPDKPVILVGGEKCADALAKIGYLATTGQGAEVAILHTDLSPLAGRTVVLWRDNDHTDPERPDKIVAGAAWQAKLLPELDKLHCRVRVAEPPAGKPDGWDAADCIAEPAGAALAETIIDEARDRAEAAPQAAKPPKDKAAGELSEQADDRPVIYLAVDKLNANTRRCAAILRDAVFMRGKHAIAVINIQDVTGPNAANDGEAEPGVVIDGVRYAKGTPIFTEPKPDLLAYWLEERAGFRKWNERKHDFVPCPCPKDLTARLVGAAHEMGLDTCRGTVSAPIMQGREIIATRGYHRPTARYLAFDATLPPVPEHPDLEECLDLMDVVLAPFADYLPKAGTALTDEQLGTKAEFLAAALTAIMRPSLSRAPIILFNANIAGAGKSKAARALGAIASGRLPSIITEGSDQKEFEKRIDAALLGGSEVILLDNLQRHIASSALESGASEGYATIREFGTLGDITVPVDALIVLTANNASIRSDMLRRTLQVRIVVESDQPETIPHKFDPYERAKKRRLVILAAGFGIIRGWLDELERRASARTPLPKNLGSFEDWSLLVAGAVEWLLKVNPVDRILKHKAEDHKGTDERELVEALHARFGHAGWRTKDCLSQPPSWENKDKAHNDLQDALMAVCGRAGKLASNNIGYWLRAHKDRVYGDLRLTSTLNRDGIAVWQILVPSRKP